MKLLVSQINQRGESVEVCLFPSLQRREIKWGGARGEKISWNDPFDETSKHAAYAVTYTMYESSRFYLNFSFGLGCTYLLNCLCN